MNIVFFLLQALVYSDAQAKQIPAKPDEPLVHFQSFDDPEWENYYFPSTLPLYDGEWKVEKSNLVPHEKMIFAKTSNAHYSLTTRFDSPLNLNDQTLVIQYETRFQESLKCGGAYLKVFPPNFDPHVLSPQTQWIILFGPDRCGANDKVKFSFRHKNPKTGQIVEHELKDCPTVKNDKLNHLYTLIVRPDNTFEILIDALPAKQGSLLEDFTPSVNPPKDIDDPNDRKPADWIDDEMIPDPTATKPDDWDEDAPEYIANPAKINPPSGWLLNEPATIPDPSVQKPAEWDDDFFGKWEAPHIDNPKCENAPGCGPYHPPAIKNPQYKGKWIAPKVKNPAYKGKWAPRKIPNPNYFNDQSVHNFDPIGGIGFEFQSTTKGIGFNNILISTNEANVHKWNRQYFYAKRRQQNIELKRIEPREGMPEFAQPQQAPKPKGARKPVQRVQNVQQQQQQPLNGADSINQIADVIVGTVVALFESNPIVVIAASLSLVVLPLTLCTLSLRPRRKQPRSQRKSSSQQPARRSKQPGQHKHRIRRKIVYEYSDGEEEEVYETEDKKPKND
ncbi:Calnexin like protein [Tritrichomonas foetus]|uniref:Calnexin like protein n=1 Tax=Tritrichomonas foetus TaxID=1144522 RepID=A0A1J4JEI8_9EUKA|nr:Calnexin like protein [Tritrichomonas foetus]|eukprot:OHS97073.1 Calnexin like protein [Tritrichomonas foetus]